MCPGLPKAWSKVRESELGHTFVVLFQDDLLPILLCTKCGAWTMKRIVKLGVRCPGRPSCTGTATKLKGLAKGIHPDPKSKRTILFSHSLATVLEAMGVRGAGTQLL